MNRNDLPTVAEFYDLEERLYKRIIDFLQESKPKKWIRTTDVQKILGKPASSIQALRDSGALPYSRIGGTIYYEYDKIMHLLEDNTVNVSK